MAAPMPNLFKTKKSSAADSAKETKSTGPRISLRPSRQTCFVLAGLIGVGLMGGVGLFAMGTSQISELNQKVAAKQAEVDGSERIARHLNASETAYADAQNQLRSLETSVTAEEYVPTLLRQMEQLAKSMNLQVRSIRPKKEPAPEPPADKEARKKFVPWPYDKEHIDLEVRGSYWDIARLLSSLTQFPKILAVESVQVQGGGTSEIKPGVTPVLTANLKLTGFIFPNDGKDKDDAKPTSADVAENALDAVADSAKNAASGVAKNVAAGINSKTPPVIQHVENHAAAVAGGKPNEKN